MDKITLDQLRQTFSDRHSGWCVSLFMPAHRAGRETKQDPIRIRNLLRPAGPGFALGLLTALSSRVRPREQHK